MSDPKRQARIGLIVILAGSLGLYLLTMAPTVQGFDSAELTMGAYDLGYVHPTGYPLYLVIGHLFSKLPLGEIGYRLNLASAVFASLAAGSLYWLAFKQTRNYLAAFSAAALFATLPILWSQAIRAEVYSLHVFLMLCALLAWYQAYRKKSRGSYLLAYVFLGLGLANHLTSILLWAAALASTIWLDRGLRKATIPAALLGLLVGGVAYLYFPWRAGAALEIDYIRPYFDVDPGGWSGVLWMVSGRAFGCLVAAPSGLDGIVGELARLVGDLFRGTLGIGLVLAVPGWAALSRTARPWNRLLSLYFIANLIAYLFYGAVDKEVMFIPLYAVVCIWFASGISALAGWIASKVLDFGPREINLGVNLAILALVIAGVAADWGTITLKDDRRAYEFAQDVLEGVSPGSTVVNHWATASVFDYLRIVEGQRIDVSSYNADFYFLGVQEACRPISNEDMLDNGWIDWLMELSTKGRLCYIEPLHGLPEGYRWRNLGVCWDLVEEQSEP